MQGVLLVSIGGVDLTASIEQGVYELIVAAETNASKS